MHASQPTALTEDAVVNTVRAGDAVAFTALVERYRDQLQVHCYRMLGSFDDSEDLVQETLLRAWRSRATFEGRSLLRTWLYRIATNACLNALERAPRRVLPQDVVQPVSATTDTSEARAEPPYAPEVPWLQPYPDSRLEPPAPSETEPEASVVSRETIELAFLAALQHLPPRQRAILILRDVLDWSARETASLLETSVTSVNSAHQRARATMRRMQPPGRADDTPPAAPTDQERVMLQTFMDAWERADADRLTALLREDARWAMPPAALWFDGRAAIVRLYELFPIDWQGRSFRMMPTAANRQPAAAAYMRPAGESTFWLTALHVLRIERGEIAEVTTFGPELCRAFGLPPSL
ncbi:MAG: sigma-70 family RNA polymerase sigma factor [Chloroflexi bacterium]|nr:MAG: sigma-70 family RNA polymerase sigma factor [Chloroflexota bacterium]